MAGEGDTLAEAVWRQIGDPQVVDRRYVPAIEANPGLALPRLVRIGQQSAAPHPMAQQRTAAHPIRMRPMAERHMVEHPTQNRTVADLTVAGMCIPSR
jgi:hypothetical protein